METIRSGGVQGQAWDYIEKSGRTPDEDEHTLRLSLALPPMPGVVKYYPLAFI